MATEKYNYRDCVKCKGNDLRHAGHGLCYKCYSRTIRNYKVENARRRKTLRKRVFEHYGWKCICCGEDNDMFLLIDHKNNDGYPRSKTGKQKISMVEMYGKIIKDNFPDSFQILCYNCNFGKRINNGSCPHKNK